MLLLVLLMLQLDGAAGSCPDFEDGCSRYFNQSFSLPNLFFLSLPSTSQLFLPVTRSQVLQPLVSSRYWLCLQLVGYPIQPYFYFPCKHYFSIPSSSFFLSILSSHQLALGSVSRDEDQCLYVLSRLLQSHDARRKLRSCTRPRLHRRRLRFEMSHL